MALQHQVDHLFFARRQRQTLPDMRAAELVGRRDGFTGRLGRDLLVSDRAFFMTGQALVVNRSESIG
jgi:hypothetical protein